MMAKPLETNIKVNAKICVDKKTAEACLKIAEIYVNENSDDIVVHVSESGEKTFLFLSEELKS